MNIVSVFLFVSLIVMNIVHMLWSVLFPSVYTDHSILLPCLIIFLITMFINTFILYQIIVLQECWCRFILVVSGKVIGIQGLINIKPEILFVCVFTPLYRLKPDIKKRYHILYRVVLDHYMMSCCPLKYGGLQIQIIDTRCFWFSLLYDKLCINALCIF